MKSGNGTCWAPRQTTLAAVLKTSEASRSLGGYQDMQMGRTGRVRKGENQQGTGGERRGAPQSLGWVKHDSTEGEAGRGAHLGG